MPPPMESSNALGDYHEHIDDDAFLCCPVPHNSSVAGVIMKNRLDRLHSLSLKNLHLTILCMMYIGVNVVCLTINSMDEDFREANELVFHLLEFWATFLFSVVQVYSLVFSPRSLGAVYSNPLVLKMVVFFNVVATFISALLVSVSLENFESPSHELEYFNEITMAFVDVVLLAVVARQAGYGQQTGTCSTVLTTVVALVVAVVQLLIYNLLDGPSGGPGEQLAHFFEFTFEILSAFISFSFCMDNKILCDKKIRLLLSKQQGAAGGAVGAVCAAAGSRGQPAGQSAQGASVCVGQPAGQSAPPRPAEPA